MSIHMFFTKDKLRGRLDEVALYRYEKTYPIRNFQTAEDMDGEIAARPDNILYDNELTIGENWSGRIVMSGSKQQLLFQTPKLARV